MPQSPVLSSGSQRESIGAATFPSILSEGLTVTGTLTSSGEIHIEGSVEGDVRGDIIVIGKKANICGSLFAKKAIVRGRVVGNIYAQNVLLTAGSQIKGDTIHKVIAIEIGAKFEGSCRNSDYPLEVAPGSGELPSGEFSVSRINACLRIAG